jgi:hypothetical protein
MAIYEDGKHNENMEHIEQPIQIFDFFLDQKITAWMRTRFCVEAHTREEAIERAKKSYEKLCEGERWEEIPDTQEVMSLKENEGCSTVEIYIDEVLAKPIIVKEIKVWENGEEM